jgi:hypothetical protein
MALVKALPDLRAGPAPVGFDVRALVHGHRSR